VILDTAASRRWPTLVSTVVRIALAIIFLISGGVKAADSDQTWVAVQAYQLLPKDGVGVVAGILPWFELALGVLLLIGLGVRICAVISAAVFIGFIAAVSQAWARGLSIDCGCFGGGGAVAPDQTSYGMELLRDAGFVVMAVWLAVKSRTLFALEDILNGANDSALVRRR
jgi:uncharacterized membrane protein YphA (DoxX/SURF4 family)